MSEDRMVQSFVHEHVFTKSHVCCATSCLLTIRNSSKGVIEGGGKEENDDERALLESYI